MTNENNRNAFAGMNIQILFKNSIKDGLTKKELAKRYGIYWSTVYKIVNGETWAHV